MFVALCPATYSMHQQCAALPENMHRRFLLNQANCSNAFRTKRLGVNCKRMKNMLTLCNVCSDRQTDKQTNALNVHPLIESLGNTNFRVRMISVYLAKVRVIWTKARIEPSFFHVRGMFLCPKTPHIRVPNSLISHINNTWVFQWQIFTFHVENSSPSDSFIRHFERLGLNVRQYQ